MTGEPPRPQSLRLTLTKVVVVVLEAAAAAARGGRYMTADKLTSPLDPLLALLAHFNSSHDLTQARLPPPPPPSPFSLR
jgi:hypothetical protein